MDSIFHASWVNAFPNKPWFLHVCSTRLLKTLCGKGEIACNSVFYLFQKLSAIFMKYKFVVYQPFSLEVSKICRLGKIKILSARFGAQKAFYLPKIILNNDKEKTNKMYSQTFIKVHVCILYNNICG